MASVPNENPPTGGPNARAPSNGQSALDDKIFRRTLRSGTPSSTLTIPYAIANTNSRAYLYAYMHKIRVIKSKHSIIAKHKQYIRTNTTKLHALRYWALAVTNVNKFQ